MATLSLPIVVTVEGALESFTLSLPVRVSALPAALVSGAASVCLGTTAAAVWTPVVTIAGADVSAQVVGEITVDAEEGAARIAEFILSPADDTLISLTEWVGKPVTIDVADASSGSPVNAMRLFTGLIDTPAFALDTRLLSLRCTDDLQGRCDGMSNAALLALIGGYTSPAIFDPAASGWTYAQDRLSTLPAALDISPQGALRVTPWAPKTTADIAFDAGILGDGSLSVSVADRAALTNQVAIAFDYRFPRIKAECYLVEYEYVNMTSFAAFILAGGWWLQREQVVAAISAAGGTVESITYTPLPDEIIAVGDGYFTPSAADADLCLGFSATVSFDYAQSITEQHRITVGNALSIAAVGRRRETMSGALEGVYPDITAAETSIRLYKASDIGIPPTDAATPSAGFTTSVEPTLSAETNRAAANAAMETLIAIAKTTIYGSHRASRVSATIPLIPAVDLDKTLRIDADGVLAQGKCVRVVHRMAPESGIATTEFSIALCAVAGVGITHAEDPTAASDGTTGASTSLTGPVNVVFNSGQTQDHQITITFPGVEEAERAMATPTIIATIAAPLVEDLFTITV